MSMQVFRNKKNMKVIYFTVAIAFVLSLGYAGVKSNLFGPDPDTLAAVNGKAIKYEEWEKEYKQRVEQYKSMFFKDGEIPELYLKDIRKSTLCRILLISNCSWNTPKKAVLALRKPKTKRG